MSRERQLNISLSNKPQLDEINEVIDQLTNATSQGNEASDALDLLWHVADQAIEAADRYNTSKKIAKGRLAALASKL